MMILKTTKGSRVMIRADAVRMIEEVEDVAQQFARLCENFLSGALRRVDGVERVEIIFVSAEETSPVTANASRCDRLATRG
jgi:hypothetical protein